MAIKWVFLSCLVYEQALGANFNLQVAASTVRRGRGRGPICVAVGKTEVNLLANRGALKPPRVPPPARLKAVEAHFWSGKSSTISPRTDYDF